MVSAIIVAAGKGTRMGTAVDKMFLEVHGCPVVAHTWGAFDDSKDVDELVLVIRDGLQNSFSELAEKYKFNKPHHFVTGGAQRQDSVWNGLQALSPSSEIVLIQDGARPCTSAQLISDTITAARETGAAVAAQRVTDTIKQSVDGKYVTHTLDRELLWAVQTPQTFRVEIIRRALSAVRVRGVQITDDTAACELIGQKVRLVLGKTPNPKVTTPEDLAMLELLLRRVPRAS